MKLFKSAKSDEQAGAPGSAQSTTPSSGQPGGSRSKLPLVIGAGVGTVLVGAGVAAAIMLGNGPQPEGSAAPAPKKTTSAPKTTAPTATTIPEMPSGQLAIADPFKPLYTKTATPTVTSVPTVAPTTSAVNELAEALKSLQKPSGTTDQVSKSLTVTFTGWENDKANVGLFTVGNGVKERTARVPLKATFPEDPDIWGSNMLVFTSGAGDNANVKFGGVQDIKLSKGVPAKVF